MKPSKQQLIKHLRRIMAEIFFSKVKIEDSGFQDTIGLRK